MNYERSPKRNFNWQNNSLRSEWLGGHQANQSDKSSNLFIFFTPEYEMLRTNQLVFCSLVQVPQILAYCLRQLWNKLSVIVYFGNFVHKIKLEGRFVHWTTKESFILVILIPQNEKLWYENWDWIYESDIKTTCIRQKIYIS